MGEAKNIYFTCLKGIHKETWYEYEELKKLFFVAN